MNLWDWMSNIQDVLEEIPVSDRCLGAYKKLKKEIDLLTY